MKNTQVIKKCFDLLEQSKLEECSKLLKKLERNFSIEDDDEFSIYIETSLSQPKKQLAEKLINEDRSDLVGDKNYLEQKGYLKYKLSIRVFYKKDGLAGHVNINKDGISSGQCSNKQDYIEFKKYVHKWLQKEFGKCDEFKPYDMF
jgi:hypothetical protein